MDLRLDFPSRAKDVFVPTATVEAGGRTAVLGPLTVGRHALLHSLESPLFYDEPRLGWGVGWLASAYVAWGGSDEIRLLRLLSEKGVAAIVVESVRWAEETFPGADPLMPCMEALRSLWRAVCNLDPAPRGGGAAGPVAASGESSTPATAPSPSSPASP